MTPPKFTYDNLPDLPKPVLNEQQVEYGFIDKLQGLKYEYRPDINNRATLEANFREKFEALNRVRLTDSEFADLHPLLRKRAGGRDSGLSDRLSAVDDLLRHPDDQPTIGLLLCRKKNKLVAEYALRGLDQSIAVAEWQTRLTGSLPDDLRGSLPTIEEIEAELSGDLANETEVES